MALNTISFKNPYDDWCENSSSFLSLDKISDEFIERLNKFYKDKLKQLTSNMREDVFNNNCVYTGSAGMALLYYTSATRNQQCNEKALLKAMAYLDIDKMKYKKISFLCGDAGPLAIAAVVSYKLGAKKPERVLDCKIYVQRLMDLGGLLSESPDELLYGRSGYLYALLFVNEQIGKEIIPANHIEKVVHAILRSGSQFAAKMKSESPLLWQWHDKIYLGAAHGMAGILYVLLQARNYVGPVELCGVIRQTLNYLTGTMFPSGNFPSSLDSSNGDKLVQWCHGAPGFVPLLILASRVYQDNKYLKTAIECGEVVWERGLCTKGYSLCHGVAGNAYTFIQLFKATKEVRYLHRACCFADWCVAERPGTQRRAPDRPASLFEGLAGRVQLAADLLRADTAAFPAHEL